MAQLFDRLNRELEVFGRRAQAALDEGKLQIELLRVRRQQDAAARDLGMLIYRRERGTEVDQRRIDSLLLRLDDLAARIGSLEADLAARRRERREQRPESDGAEPPVAAHGAAE
jgi:hypothetical protein